MTNNSGLTLDDYERLAGLLGEVYLIALKANAKAVLKKSAYFKYREKAIQHIGEARSLLEEMMFIDHHDEEAFKKVIALHPASVFYPAEKAMERLKTKEASKLS